MAVGVLKIHHSEPSILADGQVYLMDHYNVELFRGHRAVQLAEIHDRPLLAGVPLGDYEGMREKQPSISPSPRQGPRKFD